MNKSLSSGALPKATEFFWPMVKGSENGFHLISPPPLSLAGLWDGLGVPPHFWGGEFEKNKNWKYLGHRGPAMTIQEMLKIGCSYRVTSSPKVASKS